MLFNGKVLSIEHINYSNYLRVIYILIILQIKSNKKIIIILIYLRDDYDDGGVLKVDDLNGVL